MRWSLDPGAPPGRLMVHQGQPEGAGPCRPCRDKAWCWGRPPLPCLTPCHCPWHCWGADAGPGLGIPQPVLPAPQLDRGHPQLGGSVLGAGRGGHGDTAEPARPRRQPRQPPGRPAHPARRALALAAGRARLAPAPRRAPVGAQLPAAG